MFKFNKQVNVQDQGLEEGEISNDDLQVPQRTVPNPPSINQKQKNQSSDEEYIIEQVKMRPSSPVYDRKKDRKELKVEEKPYRYDKKLVPSRSPENSPFQPIIQAQPLPQLNPYYSYPNQATNQGPPPNSYNNQVRYMQPQQIAQQPINLPYGLNKSQMHNHNQSQNMYQHPMGMSAGQPLSPIKGHWHPGMVTKIGEFGRAQGYGSYNGTGGGNTNNNIHGNLNGLNNNLKNNYPHISNQNYQQINKFPNNSAPITMHNPQVYPSQNNQFINTQIPMQQQMNPINQINPMNPIPNMSSMPNMPNLSINPNMMSIQNMQPIQNIQPIQNMQGQPMHQPISNMHSIQNIQNSYLKPNHYQQNHPNQHQYQQHQHQYQFESNQYQQNQQNLQKQQQYAKNLAYQQKRKQQEEQQRKREKKINQIFKNIKNTIENGSAGSFPDNTSQGVSQKQKDKKNNVSSSKKINNKSKNSLTQEQKLQVEVIGQILLIIRNILEQQEQQNGQYDEKDRDRRNSRYNQPNKPLKQPPTLNLSNHKNNLETIHNLLQPQSNSSFNYQSQSQSQKQRKNSQSSIPTPISALAPTIRSKVYQILNQLQLGVLVDWLKERDLEDRLIGTDNRMWVEGLYKKYFGAKESQNNGYSQDQQKSRYELKQRQRDDQYQRSRQKNRNKRQKQRQYDKTSQKLLQKQKQRERDRDRDIKDKDKNKDRQKQKQRQRQRQREKQRQKSKQRQRQKQKRMINPINNQKRDPRLRIS